MKNNNDQSCDYCSELLSGYLDGELTQQQSQKISLHLKTCESCQKMLDELEQLKQLVNQKDNPKLEIEKIEAIMNDSISSTTQKVGWAVLLIAMSIALIFSTVVFFGNEQISLTEKLFTGLFWGSLLGIFLSVVRQQWLARKNDKYKGVKL